MIVVCDTFDWEDFPSYVMPYEDVVQMAQQRHGTNMQKVMEVYNLSKPFDAQTRVGRFAFDGWNPQESFLV
jgi:hypothetical protein